jgi:antirestriction protein ArdC
MIAVPTVKPAHAASDQTHRADLYSRITDQIIQALEADIRPWIQPWCAGHAAGSITRPLRHNRQPYRGINVIMLWLRASLSGYECPFWMTYRQGQELGGHIRRGEKGSTVVYSDTITRLSTDLYGQETEEQIPFLKAYTVFNAEQLDGLPASFFEPAERPLTPMERIEGADRFVERTGASISYGNSEAYYSPTTDRIAMPNPDWFADADSFYSTLLHELTHWTQHRSRLDRDLGRKRFGDAGYAMEELVAELGAAFLCADLGITTEVRVDHAAYIGTWLQVLRKDRKAVFSAAALAERATQYLHSLQCPEQSMHSAENQLKLCELEPA